jgi:DNA-binding transcriptional regulator YdaS (Cro superfamily)
MHKKTSALRRLALIASVSLVAGCASSRVFLPAEGCSSLAEGILGRVTPHAVLGDSGDADLDWKLYGAAETGQVNSANLDKKDGLAIIQRCEKRDADAASKVNAPAWQFWR